MSNLEEIVVAVPALGPAAIAVNRDTALGANQQVYSGRCRLMGYSVAPSAVNSGWNLYDGRDLTGQLLVVGGNATQDMMLAWFGPGGIAAEIGLYMNLTSAVNTWTVWFIPDP